MNEPFDPVSYQLGQRIALCEPEATAYLVKGFSFPEDWGRWTDGPYACIGVAHGKPRGQLIVEFQIARAYCADQDICDVVIEAGWGEPKLFSLGAGPARLAFLIAAEETDNVGTLMVDIHIVRPKIANEPPDARALGVGIESFKIEPLVKQ